MNRYLGCAIINLTKLFDPDSKKRLWQSFSEKFKIMAENQLGVETCIGSLDCRFVLVREKCINCKSCKDVFKMSSILKHITRSACKITSAQKIS